MVSMLVLGLIPVRTLVAVPPGNEPALGPLGGRNIYLLHMPWFSFPAEQAASRPYRSLVARSALYYVNEFDTYPFSSTEDYFYSSDGKLSPADQAKLAAMDYESTVWEIGVDWQAGRRIRLSADWRLHFLYGGFLDSIIEWWHSALRVNNAGREYFTQNMSRWNIQSESGFNYSGSGDSIAAGDLDVRAVWTFIQFQSFALAAGGAFKLPLGTRESGFGSKYPDMALEVLVDWRPWKRWAFYANAGIIFPFDGQAKIMGQCIPAVEFRISRGISLVLQMNLQSAAITSSLSAIHPDYGVVNLFSLPQTNIKVGFKGRHGRFEWQFYVEEDAFTWEGADIVLFFGAGYRF